MQIPVLIGIISTLLETDKVVNAQELAEKYEMSKRSIYRYIMVLSEGGIPIESHFGLGGGWKIVDTYKQKAIYFTKDEFSRLLFILQCCPLQDSLTKIVLEKLIAFKRSHPTAKILKSNQIITAGSDKVYRTLAVLYDCISKNIACKIKYESTQTNSDCAVEPYCLILRDKEWYAYCFCRSCDKFQYFRVANIVEMELGETFTAEHFDSKTMNMSEIDTDGACETVEIALSMENENTVLLCEKLFGELGVEKKDGQYIVTFSLPYNESLVNRVICLGSDVKVIRPEKLRSAILERCAEIIERNR